MEAAVRDYYGKVLRSSEDLRTSACCTTEAPPPYLGQAIARVHEEVQSRYYGCGLVLPEALEGCRILDLGCGSGRDCYLFSQLVGEGGEVVGVDMTEAQLAVANRYVSYHAAEFGYRRSNVRFHLGYIERLEELSLEPESFDVIISNCAINLSPDKPAVLRGAHRLLKPGGELHFADVFADRRVPSALTEDKILYGECLGGALYWNDFLSVAKSAGFLDPRLVSDRPIEITASELREKVGSIQFFSATYRLFKLASLEPACEDYGQAVIYRGTIPHHRDQFDLDSHHSIPTNKVFPVCGNTFDMLKETRFAPHFEFIGDRSWHYGIFPGCGITLPFQAESSSADLACC